MPSIDVPVFLNDIINEQSEMEILRYLNEKDFDYVDSIKKATSIASSHYHIQKLLKYDLVKKIPRPQIKKVINYKITDKGRWFVNISPLFKSDYAWEKYLLMPLRWRTIPKKHKYPAEEEELTKRSFTPNIWNKIGLICLIYGIFVLISAIVIVTGNLFYEFFRHHELLFNVLYFIAKNFLVIVLIGGLVWFVYELANKRAIFV